MDFAVYTERIRQRLKEGAPGETFQLQMAPAHRMPATAYLREGMAFRPAAVMVVLTKDTVDHRPSVLLIQRSVYNGVHSGQISLPGGKPEPEEELVQTAIRELEEETGITSQDIEIAGALTPLYIPPSQFLVHPYVAICEVLPEIRPQEREVQKVFTFPVAFLDPSKSLQHEFAASGGIRVIAPAWEISGDIRIWGATAMILSEVFALHQ